MFTRIGVLSLVMSALLPVAARADGLPVPVDGAHAIASRDGAARFVTRRVEAYTVVRRLDHGRVTGSVRLHGKFGIPVVAIDGSVSGLSRDGGTLVLIKPRRGFPRTARKLALVDARDMRVRRVLTLHGDFSFDALSPD